MMELYNGNGEVIQISPSGSNINTVHNMFDNAEVKRGYLSPAGDFFTDNNWITFVVDVEELHNYTFNFLDKDNQYMAFVDETGSTICSTGVKTESPGAGIDFSQNGVKLFVHDITTKVVDNESHSLQTVTAPLGAARFKIACATTDPVVFCMVQGTSADWTTPGNTAPENITQLHKGEVMYTFGDSITQGTNGGFQKYIRDITGYAIVNYAYSGLTATSLVDKVCTDDVDFSRASTVTIMVGTNGGVNSTIEDIPYIVGGTVADIEDGKTITHNDEEISTVDAYWELFNTQKYHAAIAKIIEWARWKNPHIKIRLITPTMNAFRGLTIDGGHEAIRTAMYEIGKYYGVRVIDAVREAGFCLHNINELTYDGTHYTVDGNRVYGEYVGTELNFM